MMNVFMKIFGNILFFVISVHFFVVAYIACASFYMVFYNPKMTSLMVYRKIINDIEPKEIFFAESEEIKRKYIKLIIDTEDPDFFSHYGIEIQEIKNAYKLNKKLGYIYSGGSTITQQLARTLFWFPDKLYIRKYFEIISAVEMDLILSKERIIELYINYIETGRGLYGMETASRFYFKKPLAKLNDSQMIKLITIIASPVKYTPTTFQQRKRLKARYDWLINHFYRK